MKRLAPDVYASKGDSFGHPLSKFDLYFEGALE
jgi:hypothetical protein